MINKNASLKLMGMLQADNSSTPKAGTVNGVNTGKSKDDSDASDSSPSKSAAQRKGSNSSESSNDDMDDEEEFI
jgi:hypothetical protein